MQSGNITKESIIKILEEIPDPEIPVVNIVELGMVKDVVLSDDSVVVQIMPTYTACPATWQIQSDVQKKLVENGIKGKVEIVYSPAWTTDRISKSALEKLNQYGIAPPQNKVTIEELREGNFNITCPRCGSNKVELISMHGSTPCKALMRCKECKETFDYFKCHL